MMEAKDIVWEPDILGRGYESARIDHPDDYAGAVCSTIIRRRRATPGDKAVLYVHGFSDYFLQHELGEQCNLMGYEFYAVDLRKYGRSHLPSQKFFQVKDLEEYFPDIQAAIDLMKADGITRCALLGHSTGGLTATLYMSRAADPIIRALVLNSPFLAWNMPAWQRVLIPAIAAMGRFFPDMVIPQPKDTRYARSLRAAHGGEWEYDTSWKPDQMPDVDAAWVRAIERAQRQIRRGANISVPILLLTSSLSAKPDDDMEVFRRADGVLDVRKILKTGKNLGPSVTAISITDGLHDLALSAPAVRHLYYREVFNFLAETL